MKAIILLGCSIIMLSPVSAQPAAEVSMTLTAKPQLTLSSAVRASLKEPWDAAYSTSNVRHCGYPIFRMDGPGPAYRQLRENSEASVD